MADLAAPDLAVPDLAVSAPPDLAGCGGGYLNSDAGDACPLACSPLVEAVADEGALHVPFFTPVTYAHDPPASGMHWPSPAPWGVHAEIVPREWWVHNLEHGGIVLLYNCPSPDAGAWTDGGAVPDDCPAVIAALANLYASWPQDNWFDAFYETRILVTPDPLLPGRVGAVAWDWSFVNSFADVNALDCFIAARYGRGPENAP